MVGFGSLGAAAPFCALIAAALDLTVEPIVGRAAGARVGTGLTLEVVEACEAVDGIRFLIALTVEAEVAAGLLLMVEGVDVDRDLAVLTDAVEGVGDFGRAAFLIEGAREGVGDFGRATLRTEGAREGVGDFCREGPATAFVLEGIDLLAVVAVCEVVGPVGVFVGDLGLVVARGIAEAEAAADVRVVLTEVTEADDGPAAAAGEGRAISGLIGPLICLPCLVDGVGLSLFRPLAEPMLTLGPSLAAVGLRAEAVPGRGAVVGTGPETDRADLALVTEDVEAELLSLNRLRPGASVVASARSAGGRAADEVCVDVVVVVRILAASDSDMTRDVVRGIPTPGPDVGRPPVPSRVRTSGDNADGPSSSSTLTSISVVSSMPIVRPKLHTIADLLQSPVFEIVKSPSIANLHPSSPNMGEDTFAGFLNLLSRA
jgi:hypothetical protein